MKYQTHNDRRVDINGTHLQGYVTASYARLKELFGEPQEGDAYKVDAEWGVQFDDGTVATIYNWKNGRNYCGDDGEPTESITDWHIGGFDKDAEQRVKEAIAGQHQRDIVIQGECRRVPNPALIAGSTTPQTLGFAHGDGK